jgi:hypothetical protein
MGVAKPSSEKSSSEGRLYTNLIIEIVYQHGCITKKRLADIIAERTGKPRESVYKTIGKYLQTLVKHGVIERRYHGIYCRPQFVRSEQPT